MFIECLKKGKDFRLENCIVDGYVDIREIYNRIKNDNGLKGLLEISEKLIGKKLVDTEVNKCVYVTIPISITILNAEFRGILSFDGGVNGVITKFGNENVFISLIFKKEVKFLNTTFEENVYFRGINFKENVKFLNSIFKRKADFSDSIIGRCTFYLSNFYGNVDFSEVTFGNDAFFVNSIFKSITKFEEIRFNLLVFSECIFEYISHFKSKQDNNGFAVFHKSSFGYKEVIIENFPLSKTSFLKTDVRGVLILCDVEDKKILSHELLNFKEYLLISDIIDKLNNISFEDYTEYDDIYTKIQKLLDIENEKPFDFTIKVIKIKVKILLRLKIQLKKFIKILATFMVGGLILLFFLYILLKITNLTYSVALLIVSIYSILYVIILFVEIALVIFLIPYWRIYEQYKNLKMDIYGTIYKYIHQSLNYKSVLAEYRNLRLSMENNRTYIEASELFKKEMDLIKEKSDIFEKFVIWLYGTISDYGESITKPILISMFVILAFPYITYFLNWVWMHISKLPLLNGFLNENGLAYEQILRAFFQLGMNEEVINNNKELQTLASYEWLIRIISLILLGSLFIAIKRRLERK
ncbi:hypothetical protein JH146_0623 [Methanocaldococcus bathoardescens]|uniref:Uncharacterized protein n=2 Tax=Methanocaldococcus bathoardescens TaxID=1301915 RepID=A0A076LF59_9EURY|nr:hypothetical protein JH146_0623 [Methanocaldococcus bathoardescens]